MKAIDCAVINKSTLVSDSDLLKWTIACAKQLREHAAPACGWETPAVHWLPDARFIQDGMDVIYVFDDSDSPGALGWHDVDDAGRPFGRVFARDCIENGASVSSCLSHELLELCGDPMCDEWARNNNGYDYAREECDAVEEDVYEIDGVEVSDFVLPSFFEQNGAAPYDFLGLLSEPFQTRTGGYQIRRDQNTGAVSQVYGDHRAEWRKKGKEHPAARSARRMRS